MGKYSSKGSEALADAAKRRGHNQRDVAAALEIDAPSVSRLLGGKRQATLKVQRAAEEKYGIPAGWWAQFLAEQQKMDAA